MACSHSKSRKHAQFSKTEMFFLLLHWISQQKENTWAINLILWWSVEHLFLDESWGHSSLQPRLFYCAWSRMAYPQCHFAYRIGIKSGTWFCNSKRASRMGDSCLRQLVLGSQPLGRMLHPREQTGIQALLGELRFQSQTPCFILSPA